MIAYPGTLRETGCFFAVGASGAFSAVEGTGWSTLTFLRVAIVVELVAVVV